MIFIVAIISLFLNNLILNFIPYTINNLSMFTPMFYIVALILVYPFFLNNNNKYYIFSFGYGLLIDIINTDTFFLNALIFIILAFIIIKIKKILTNNLINNIIIVLLVITVNELLIFFFLTFINYINHDIIILINKVYNSLFINIIYTIFLYFILNYISNKYNIKKIE